MAPMTSAFDLRAAAAWFRLVALAEAVSWVGLLVGIALNWTVGTWLLASLASVVPLCSVIFLIWADRTGRMGTANASTGVLQPGRSIPETT